MSDAWFTIIPKRVLDFSNINTFTQEVVLADRVDVLRWRVLQLRVQIHSHDLAGTSNTMQFRAYAQSVSAEDPSLQFVVLNGFIQIGTASPNPGYINLDMTTTGTNPIPALARICATGTRNGGGLIRAVVSIEISGKE